MTPHIDVRRILACKGGWMSLSRWILVATSDHCKFRSLNLLWLLAIRRLTRVSVELQRRLCRRGRQDSASRCGTTNLGKARPHGDVVFPSDRNNIHHVFAAVKAVDNCSHFTSL